MLEENSGMTNHARSPRPHTLIRLATLELLEELERRLLAEINLDEDCLRLYRLADTRGCEVREYDKFKATDFTGPLVL